MTDDEWTNIVLAPGFTTAGLRRLRARSPGAVVLAGSDERLQLRPCAFGRSPIVLRRPTAPEGVDA